MATPRMTRAHFRLIAEVVANITDVFEHANTADNFRPVQ